VPELSLDPFRPFKFRVRWDSRVVPGITHVGPLRWSLASKPDASSDGGSRPTLGQVLDPFGLFGTGGLLGGTRGRGERVAAGLEPSYAAVRLERGRTHDTAFEDWAATLSEAGRRREPPQGFQKAVALELLNESGQPVLAFRLRGCVPLEYEALGALDAADAGVATETLTLGYERFERNLAVSPPAPPSF
jgi:phage tail-like protein